jgi:hypothetical protein
VVDPVIVDPGFFRSGFAFGHGATRSRSEALGLLQAERLIVAEWLQQPPCGRIAASEKHMQQQLLGAVDPGLAT